MNRMRTRRVVAAHAPICLTHPGGSTRRMHRALPHVATPSSRGSCGWADTMMGGAARSRPGSATAAVRGNADTEANATAEVEKLLESEQPRLWSNLSTPPPGQRESLVRDKGSMSGAVFLTAGTTVGAGILALPAETQPSGFVASSVAIVVCWAYMVRRRSARAAPRSSRPFRGMKPEGCVRTALTWRPVTAPLRVWEWTHTWSTDTWCSDTGGTDFEVVRL